MINSEIHYREKKIKKKKRGKIKVPRKQEVSFQVLKKQRNASENPDESLHVFMSVATVSLLVVSQFN